MRLNRTARDSTHRTDVLVKRGTEVLVKRGTEVLVKRGTEVLAPTLSPLDGDSPST
jgi:hypothetical protein